MKLRYLCTCGCGKILDHGEKCEFRQKQDRARKNRFDRKRPSARERGYNWEWQKARKEYLERHPFCRFGCGRLATLVDHVIPHKGSPRLFWDRTNWQPLCTPCHSREKQRRERNQ